MFYTKRGVMLLGLLSAFGATTATAEPLVAITADHVLFIDSSAPSTVVRVVSYSLPSGFVTIGGDIDVRMTDGLILGRSNNTCGLFRVGGADGSTTFTVTSEDSFACSSPAAAGDVEIFPNGGDPTSSKQDRLVPAGTVIYDSFRAADGSFSEFTVPVTSTARATTNVVAMAIELDSSSLIYDVDGTANVLQIVTPHNDDPAHSSRATSASVADVGPLSITITKPVSLDQSATSGELYLATNGKLYRVNPSDGAAEVLGSLPEGTIAVIANADGSGGGSSGGTSGGSSGGSSGGTSGGSSGGTSGGSSGGTSGGSTGGSSGNSSGGAGGGSAGGTSGTSTDRCDSLASFDCLGHGTAGGFDGVTLAGMALLAARRRKRMSRAKRG